MGVKCYLYTVFFACLLFKSQLTCCNSSFILFQVSFFCVCDCSYQPVFISVAGTCHISFHLRPVVSKKDEGEKKNPYGMHYLSFSSANYVMSTSPRNTECCEWESITCFSSTFECKESACRCESTSSSLPLRLWPNIWNSRIPQSREMFSAEMLCSESRSPLFFLCFFSKSSYVRRISHEIDWDKFWNSFGVYIFEGFLKGSC